VTANPTPNPAATEEKLRELIRLQPWFGDWDEWEPVAYRNIPVLPRAALEHLYGLHDDTELAYAHCVLCQTFRIDAPAADIAEAENRESE
jgi:hypothetical protein